MEKEIKRELEQLQNIYDLFKNNFSEVETQKIEKLVIKLKLKAQEETLINMSEEIESILKDLSNYSIEDIKKIIWSYYMSIPNPDKILVSIKELQEVIVTYKITSKIKDNRKIIINRGVQSILRLKIKRLLELLRSIKLLQLNSEIINSLSESLKSSLIIFIPVKVKTKLKKS